MLCTYLQAPIAASAAACALASSSHQIYLITFCHAMADPNESRAAWRRHGVGSGDGRPTHSDSQRGRRTPQCKPRTFGGVPITKSRTMKTKKWRFVEMYYTEDTEWQYTVHEEWLFNHWLLVEESYVGGSTITGLVPPISMNKECTFMCQVISATGNPIMRSRDIN